jgi:hypothetical protein
MDCMIGNFEIKNWFVKKSKKELRSANQKRWRIRVSAPVSTEAISYSLGSVILRHLNNVLLFQCNNLLSNINIYTVVHYDTRNSTVRLYEGQTFDHWNGLFHFRSLIIFAHCFFILVYSYWLLLYRCYYLLVSVAVAGYSHHLLITLLISYKYPSNIKYRILASNFHFTTTVPDHS